MRLWLHTIGFWLMVAGGYGYLFTVVVFLILVATPDSNTLRAIVTALGFITFLCLVLVIVGAVVAFICYLIRPKPPATATIVVGPVAGWIPNPNDATTLRYWDGTQWTGQTAKKNA